MQNQNSGGWRFGNGGSNQFLYKNEGIDNELLKRAAELSKAPAGLLDSKINASPLDQALQQVRDGGTSSYGASESSAPSAPTSNKASDAWGANQFGYNVGYSPTNGMKGFAALGPLGALAGLQVSKDPLGQFAYQQLVAQEQRDALNGGFDSGVAAGGGWSSLSPDTQASVANAADPIGAFADAIGMSGGDSGGYGDGGGYDGGYGSDGSGGVGSSGDSSGGYGAGVSGGNNSGGDGTGSGGDVGWFKGGNVTQSRLIGPDPVGPDTGYGALQDGEVVIKKSSVKKYGKGLLAEINAGTYKG